MRDNKLTIPIIAVLIIAIISIGIAFATFSTTLNINGQAQVDASNWEIVFEGKTNPNVMDAPTIVGTATQVTLPTIKNNATEISTYSVTLKTPGDSITYDFKIHNKGSYDASISSLVISGVSNPSSAISGSALVTDSSIATANASTLNQIEYKFYYTDDNTLVGQNPTRDCLASGETENVSLRIVFSTSQATDTSILPSTDLVLNNLGVTMVYTQGQTCQSNNSGGNGGNSGGNEQPSQESHYVYAKEISGEPNICILVNSQEYCFDKYTTPNGFNQTCTSMGGTYTFNEGMGCDGGDSYNCLIGHNSIPSSSDFIISVTEVYDWDWENSILTSIDLDIYIDPVGADYTPNCSLQNSKNAVWGDVDNSGARCNYGD
jgi:hypothetical protein